MLKIQLVSLLLLALSFVSALAQPTNVLYDVRTFGAVGVGVALDTKPLQAAIDKCSAAGGGTVLVTGGKFVAGTFYLKSDVTLRVDAGAMIACTNGNDYSYKGRDYQKCAKIELESNH